MHLISEIIKHDLDKTENSLRYSKNLAFEADIAEGKTMASHSSDVAGGDENKDVRSEEISNGNGEEEAEEESVVADEESDEDGDAEDDDGDDDDDNDETDEEENEDGEEESGDDDGEEDAEDDNVNGEENGKIVISDEEKAEAETEMEAIAEATKVADESYKPSQSLLQSSSPYPLIRSVDGISLKTYNSNPSRFSATDMNVPLRGKLNVPIHVTSSGSVVEFTVECKDYDIGFGISAEREEGVTIVKKESRQDAHLEPINGRFLVGSVPCALIFTFNNDYSWMREKKVNYKIKVTPPSIKNIISGRRTRAKQALSVVLEDKDSAESRLERVSSKHSTLVEDIDRLEKQLEELKKSRGVVEKEEEWLKTRVQLRDIQQSLLSRRLTEGWEDELGSENREKDESGSVDRAEI